MANTAATREAFLGAYPEFDQIEVSQVDAKLAEANDQTGSDWGNLRDKAAMLLTAHLLSVSPLGEMAKHVTNATVRMAAVQSGNTHLANATTYLAERHAMRRRVFVPMGVGGT